MDCAVDRVGRMAVVFLFDSCALFRLLFFGLTRHYLWISSLASPVCLLQYLRNCSDFIGCKFFSSDFFEEQIEWCLICLRCEKNRWKSLKVYESKIQNATARNQIKAFHYCFDYPSVKNISNKNNLFILLLFIMVQKGAHKKRFKKI